MKMSGAPWRWRSRGPWWTGMEVPEAMAPATIRVAVTSMTQAGGPVADPGRPNASVARGGGAVTTGRRLDPGCARLAPDDLAGAVAGRW